MINTNTDELTLKEKQGIKKFDIGKDCKDDDECIFGYCINGKCGQLVSLGEPCTEDKYCRSGICINNLCSKHLLLGQSCDKNYHCNSGYCVDGRCSSNKPLLFKRWKTMFGSKPRKGNIKSYYK